MAGMIGLGVFSVGLPAFAASSLCSVMPSQAKLKAALISAVAGKNGGLEFNMWVDTGRE
jgi:hypothetical protein